MIKRKNRIVKTNVELHFVFLTKLQYGVLTPAIQEFLKAEIERLVALSGHQLKVVICTDNYMHFSVSMEYKLDMNISKLVNAWKGVSSRSIAKEFGHSALHGEPLWSASFYAGSSYEEAQEYALTH